MKLLNHFDIRKPLVSYFEHNKYASGAKILERIIAGENCALVTDAGMPAISDPGEELVRMCADSGVEVLVVPGPAPWFRPLRCPRCRRAGSALRDFCPPRTKAAASTWKVCAARSAP